MTISKAFEAYFDGSTAYFNKCEWRAKQVYENQKKGYPPWQWDYEHYTGDNEDMVGFWYPEDMANNMQIEEMENRRPYKK